MSDIQGEGYGSKHNWWRDITDTWQGHKGTRYFCTDCNITFLHFYELIPDIFSAMQNNKLVSKNILGVEGYIPEECERSQNENDK